MQDRPLYEAAGKRVARCVVGIERPDELVLGTGPLDQRRADPLAAPLRHDEPVRHPRAATALFAEARFELDQPQHPDELAILLRAEDREAVRIRAAAMLPAQELIVPSEHVIGPPALADEPLSVSELPERKPVDPHDRLSALCRRVRGASR